MGFLTIKYYETIIARFEVASLQLAKDYVNSENVSSGQIGVYSTFNEAGVENTINIIKQ